MTLQLIITSDKERLEILLKDRDLNYAKEVARKTWTAIEGAVYMSIKELQGNGQFKPLFNHEKS